MRTKIHTIPMTQQEFYTLIDQTVELHQFKNIKEAIKWAKTTNSKKYGNTLSEAIKQVSQYKTADTICVLSENNSEEKYAMLVDGSKKWLRITVGELSELAN